MINNELYDSLGDRWYTAQDDPVALLRAESRLRSPWVISRITETHGHRPLKVLDLACGAGFLSNELARVGHEVTGVDLSQESLEVARKRDLSGKVRYLRMDAHRLELSDESFDIVCSMDFLEHTSDPAGVVREVARVLKPGGDFFFHTFNRNPVSRIIAIRGVEWFVRNTPKDLHVYELFIKPSELIQYCKESGMAVQEIRGSRPRMNLAFLKMLWSGRVPDDFEFKFTRNLLMGYSGIAKKE